MKDYCHCTGRQSKWCHCNYVVKEHHSLKARVKAAKAIAWVIFGGLLVVAALGLTGCAVKPEANPYPNGQFQGSVEQWDQSVADKCKEIAVVVVADAYDRVKGEKPSAEQIDFALRQIYGQCLADHGRQI